MTFFYWLMTSWWRIMSDIFDLLNILEMLYYHVDTLVTVNASSRPADCFPLYYTKSLYISSCYQGVHMIVEYLWNAENVKNIWHVTSSWRHQSIKKGQFLHIGKFLSPIHVYLHEVMGYRETHIFQTSSVQMVQLCK